MQKKTKISLLLAILDQIKTKPMGVNEVAEKIDSNWDTVKNNLEVLTALGLCEEKKSGEKRITYQFKPVEINKNKNTWFGLPITEKQVKNSLHYFNTARVAWIKTTGFEPNDTQLQKTVIEMLKEKPADVPYGWYQYGPLCLLRYKEFQNEKVIKENSPIYTTAVKIAKDLSKYKNTGSLLNEIYGRYEKQTYQLKLSIIRTISEGISDENKPNLVMDLNKLMINYNQEIQNHTTEISEYVLYLLETFVSLTSQIILQKDNRTCNSIRYEISDKFSNIWKLMTSLIFFYDMENYVDKEIVQKHLGSVYFNLVNDAELALDKLNTCVPRQKIKPNPLIAKFAGIEN